MSIVPPIRDVVDGAIRDGKVYRAEMIETLVAREDAIADALRMAAAQFGMYPEIVAKVLMDVEMGSMALVSPETQNLINGQFNALMERLQQEFRDRNGDNG